MKKKLKLFLKMNTLNSFCYFYSVELERLLHTSSANEQVFSIRGAVLDIYTLLPAYGEAVKPYLNDIMMILIKILAEDFEANGLIAMHLFMEFHKIFRGIVEPSVQPFIDLVLCLLEKFPRNFLEFVTKGSSWYRLIPTAQSVKLSLKVQLWSFYFSNCTENSLMIIFSNLFHSSLKFWRFQFRRLSLNVNQKYPMTWVSFLGKFVAVSVKTIATSFKPKLRSCPFGVCFKKLFFSFKTISSFHSFICHWYPE